MTVAAFHQLELGPAGTQRVAGAKLRAALHGTEQIEVTLELGERLDAEGLVGERARLCVGDAAFEAIVEEVVHEGTGRATVTMSHALTALERTIDHRVLCDRDAADIAAEVLGEHQLELERRLEARPAARRQCVQAFESDLAFVCRILAEDGVALWIERRDGRPTVVFGDHPSAFQPIEGVDELGYEPDEGMHAAEAVVSAVLRRRLCTGRVTLRDAWHERPSLDLTAEAGAGPLEHYGFPGPERYFDPDRGRALADRWLEAERRHAVVLEAVATCPRLAVGRTFVLHGAPREDMCRRWLVVKLDTESHEHAAATRRFEAHLVAVPADAGWRPPLPPAPRHGSIRTATITGPPGEEIHTDGLGRVKARLRHDRRGPEDDRSSAWLRSLHPPTSGGFMLPRVGWEALLGFAGRWGDVPIVLGRLDNGAAPTAEKLPAEQRRGNLGTPTTPGGGSQNLWRADDTAGAEQMLVNASRDYNEQTAANKAVTVTGDDSTRIGTTQELICETNHGINVSGAQTVAVGGGREVSGNDGMAITVGAEDVVVGGKRTLTVGGDCGSAIGGELTRAVGGLKSIVAVASNNRHVSGMGNTVVGGAWLEYGVTSAITVGGFSLLTSASTMLNAGEYTLFAVGLAENAGSRTEVAGANIGIVAASATLGYGAVANLTAPLVKLKGTGSVTVRAGGAVIEVKPGSVTFTGAFVVGGNVHLDGVGSHG